MFKTTATLAIGLGLGFLGFAVAPMRAQTSAPATTNISWAAKDVSGSDVKVPVGDRASILAFIRADQEQSMQALKQIRKCVPDGSGAKVLVIVSGPLAAEQVKTLPRDAVNGWPVIADPEFAASGKMSIHVWPTTLVVKPDGTQAAHLAGMPQSFASDLAAYLEYASGKIDDAKLQDRLAAHDVVSDTPAQIAARHLQVAQRLVERGRADEARVELAEGLKHAPDDPMLCMTLARVQVMLNQPKDALDTLDKLGGAAASANWQASLIRGRALIALEKWNEAKQVLPEALKLNPDPSEARYLLGVCFQHDGDFTHAAEQFRLAFEASPAGQKVTVSSPNQR